MSTVQIHGIPPSSYTMSARMMCNEKGIEHDFHPVQMKSEAHLALHPFGKVPAMTHGDVTLYETAAIGRYVDDVFEGPALTPTDAVERATMEQWISNVNCYLYPDMVPSYILAYLFPRGEGGTVKRETIEAALPRMDLELKLLAGDLGDRTFLGGDRPNLADCMLGPILAGIGRFEEGKALLGKHGSIGRYVGAIAGRESFQRTIPSEG